METESREATGMQKFIIYLKGREEIKLMRKYVHWKSSYQIAIRWTKLQCLTMQSIILRPSSFSYRLCQWEEHFVCQLIILWCYPHIIWTWIWIWIWMHNIWWVSGHKYSFLFHKWVMVSQTITTTEFRCLVSPTNYHHTCQFPMHLSFLLSLETLPPHQHQPLLVTRINLEGHVASLISHAQEYYA